jgi:hypothetical protein
MIRCGCCAIRFPPLESRSKSADGLKAKLAPLHYQRERISEELHKIIDAHQSSRCLILCTKPGSAPLSAEVSALQGGRNRWKEPQRLFSTTPHRWWIISPHADKARWLRYAALFHDIGKPRTKRFVNGQGLDFSPPRMCER